MRSAGCNAIARPVFGMTEIIPIAATLSSYLWDTTLAKPTAEDILTDLTEEQLDGIRRRVRASIDGVEAGKFLEYEGREGLQKLADGVKARGRQLLARQAPGK